MVPFLQTFHPLHVLFRLQQHTTVRSLPLGNPSTRRNGVGPENLYFFNCELKWGSSAVLETGLNRSCFCFFQLVVGAQLTMIHPLHLPTQFCIVMVRKTGWELFVLLGTIFKDFVLLRTIFKNCCLLGTIF